MPVRSGRLVRTKARQIPGALSLNTIALRIPGPHHSFSVDRPALIGPASTAAVDCPGSTYVKPLEPKRSGASIEYWPTCHGVEKGLRPAGRGSSTSGGGIAY